MMYEDDIVPDEVLEQEARDREQAEREGLWDDCGEDYECQSCKKLSESQEYALWSAMSTLSDLVKETNSSLSELVNMSGFKFGD